MRGKKSVWGYIKEYKFNSLLSKTFIYVFVLVTIPLLLMVVLNYRNFNQEVNKRMMDMNEELLQKNASVVDNVMTEIQNTLDSIAKREGLIRVIKEQEENSDYLETLQMAMNLLHEMTTSNSYIKEVYLYSEIKKKVITGSRSWNVGITGHKDKWYYVGQNVSMEVPYILVDQKDEIYMCQPIFNEAGEKIGILILELEAQAIWELLESKEAVQQGMFFLIDFGGGVIHCNKQDFHLFEERDRQDYIDAIVQVQEGNSMVVTKPGQKVISMVGSEHKSWRYALVTDVPVYEEEARTIRVFLVSSIAMGIITSIIAAYVITFITYRPVKKILGVILEPSLHWNDEATKESNELLYITSNILNTLNAKEQMSLELEERVRALRQSQFRALQLQIDPHFLYNTLETIKWSSVEALGLGNKVSKMLTKMAQFYRAALENDDTIIPLKKELEFLKLYIDIINIRFSESITFHWEIDESVLDCNVIKMCLQPLVENAINHGLRPKSYCGNITICAYREAGKLFIEVRNDGEGMSESAIRNMNKKFSSGVGFEENKVGLRNVNERVKLVYGKEYGVYLDCIQEQKEEDVVVSGMRVVIVFPCS